MGKKPTAVVSRIIIFGWLFFTAHTCVAQATTEWKKYLQDSVYNSERPEYVYLYVTKGGKLQTFLNYKFKKGANVLSINYGDSVVTSKIIQRPNVFAIVYNNLEKIRRVQESLNNKKNAGKFLKKFGDPAIITKQLGIRYGDLHYNHFPKFSVEEIENTRDTNCREGMKIINGLYQILETAEKQE